MFRTWRRTLTSRSTIFIQESLEEIGHIGIASDSGAISGAIALSRWRLALRISLLKKPVKNSKQIGYLSLLLLCCCGV